MKEALKTLRADIQHKIWQAMVGEDTKYLVSIILRIDKILEEHE